MSPQLFSSVNTWTCPLSRGRGPARLCRNTVHEGVSPHEQKGAVWPRAHSVHAECPQAGSPAPARRLSLMSRAWGAGRPAGSSRGTEEEGVGVAPPAGVSLPDLGSPRAQFSERPASGCSSGRRPLMECTPFWGASPGSCWVCADEQARGLPLRISLSPRGDVRRLAFVLFPPISFSPSCLTVRLQTPSCPTAT